MGPPNAPKCEPLLPLLGCWGTRTFNRVVVTGAINKQDLARGSGSQRLLKHEKPRRSTSLVDACTLAYHLGPMWIGGGQNSMGTAQATVN